MELTLKQNGELQHFSTELDRQKSIVEGIEGRLKFAKKALALYDRHVKYLQALKSDDLQGQLEAKLNWVMLKPIEFIYNGIKVKCTYSGSWGAYGKSIKLSGKHYDMEQIIKENVIT